MKTKLPVYFLSALLFGTSIQAFSQTADYQVTGPVLELNAKKIVVQKGDEKWEVARDASTKVDGELKIGSKVTITTAWSPPKSRSRATSTTSLIR